MSYFPQPGTIAYRAIAWLQKQPAETKVTASMWAEGMGGTDAVTLVPCLKPALMAGLVKEGTKNGVQRPRWYWLGEGVPLVQEEPEEEVLPQRNSAPDIKPRAGQLLPGVAAAPAAEEMANPVEEPPKSSQAKQAPSVAARPKNDEAAFDAWFSGGTGQLYLRGLVLNEDGDAILSKARVRIVLAALSGVAQ